MKRFIIRLSLILFPTVFTVSCTAPSVKELRRPLVETPLLSALLNPNKLTPASHAFLRERNLDRTYRNDPEAAVMALRHSLHADPSHANRIALIELCSDTAEQLAAREPRKAVGYHLAAAELAYENAVSRVGVRSERDELIAAYNHSSGRAAAILSSTGHAWDRESSFQGAGKTYQLTCRNDGNGIQAPTFFDSLTPSEYLGFKKIKLDRVRRAGFGAAMVGHRDATPERRRTNPFLPPVGMALPVNATLEFSRGGKVELSLHDLTVVDEARLGGRNLPLAADLTAPLAILYNYGVQRKAGWKGLLHPDEYLDRTGLFQLEPFRKDQIPVVFVHGLMSSPEVWLSALNQLRADPVLRRRYQLLAFRYPTGFPIAYNAAALRSHLKSFQDHFDPGRRNPNMRKMILIGHSMGGILSDAQIRSSGNTLTSKMFTKPLDELRGVTAGQRSTLKDLLVYEASPDVTRAVFIAAPHRGSKIAKGPIGGLGRKLIKFPFEVLTAQPLPEIAGMTELGRYVATHRPDSIWGLRPDAQGPAAILEQPIRKGVIVHTIVGNHKPSQPLQESSDAVVPYSSAHLDVAATEKVVHATHTTICQHPEAIEEVRRILYLHADLRMPEQARIP